MKQIKAFLEVELQKIINLQIHRINYDFHVNNITVILKRKNQEKPSLKEYLSENTIRLEFSDCIFSYDGGISTHEITEFSVLSVVGASFFSRLEDINIPYEEYWEIRLSSNEKHGLWYGSPGNYHITICCKNIGIS